MINPMNPNIVNSEKTFCTTAFKEACILLSHSSLAYSKDMVIMMIMVTMTIMAVRMMSLPGDSAWFGTWHEPDSLLLCCCRWAISCWSRVSWFWSVAIEIIVLLTTAKEAMFICMLLFFHQCEVVGYNRGLLGIVVGTDAGWLVVANVQPWPWLGV